jgi:hypothetical protein
MSTLHTFGCSFTEEFKEFMDPSLSQTSDGNVTTRTKYILDYHNGVAPDGWPTMLANKLGCDLKNYAGCNSNEGNSNFSIFNNICNNLIEFKKDDIVIIEWTFMERIKFVNEKTNNMLNVLASHHFDIDDKTKDALDVMMINRSHELWIKELFTHQKIINKVCELIGVNLYYWTIDPKILEYKMNDKTENGNYLILNELKNTKKNYTQYVSDLGGLNISNETNFKIKDNHLGFLAHKILSDLFYEHIKL